MILSTSVSNRSNHKLVFSVVLTTIGIVCAALTVSLSSTEPEFTSSRTDSSSLAIASAQASSDHSLANAVAVDIGEEQPSVWTEQELIAWLEQWLETRLGPLLPPTTLPPTTLPPTTLPPTTAPPTTSAPTTVSPTTALPSTVPPTTVPPTTPPPTSVAPTTATPTTQPTTTQQTTTTQLEPSAPNLFRLTLGSGNSTELDNSSPPGPVSAHGTRIYCATSHFSYDDPVVFPGRSGAAHAHMYWGNTGANAFSTKQSLMTSGNSSCEGGTNNRSAYWMPAMFDGENQVTIPESIFVYYKSFGGPDFQRSTIQPIPAGLEILATRDVRGASDSNFRIDRNGSGIRMNIGFPQCIAVDRSGQPVLSSPDNVSHLSYAIDHSNPNGCPASHPYRIPTVIYILAYDIPFDSNWYLSSDRSTATKGESLHADYIAAWDPATMDAVVECNIQARRNCQFPGRDQLPERFFNVSGERIYRYSVTLEPDADRTPFGTQIRKSRP